MVATPDRLVGLIKEDRHTEARPTRTAAQRRASRINGHRSRGPITPAGKLRSSQNATKHALLSARFMPLADTRDDDRLYRRTRRELVEQFEPATFMARVTVDMLAADIVQLTRCRAMIEDIQKPQQIVNQDLQDYRRLREAQRDLKAVRRASERLTAGRSLDCGPRAAAHVAACIAEACKGVRDYVFMEDGIPIGQMDPAERREYDEYAERWQKMERYETKLLDILHLADVARGVAKGASGERRAIHTALTQSMADLTRVVSLKEKFEARMVSNQAEALSATARSPERLILLQRYAARIERGIARKLAELRRQ